MIVTFRRPWWNGHEGVLYDRTTEGVEVPDKYESILPSTTKILSMDEAKAEKKKAKAEKAKQPKEVDTLSELSKMRADDLKGA